MEKILIYIENSETREATKEILQDLYELILIESSDQIEDMLENAKIKYFVTLEDYKGKLESIKIPHNTIYISRPINREYILEKCK